MMFIFDVLTLRGAECLEQLAQRILIPFLCKTYDGDSLKCVCSL